VHSRLPFSKRALINAQEFLAIDRFHFEVKSPLLDVFANVPGIGWILIIFP
jgi:hypothetical protein